MLGCHGPIRILLRNATISSTNSQVAYIKYRAVIGKGCIVRYHAKPELIGAPIDDELVLLHVERGEYISLSGAGPDLWSWLQAPSDIETLVDHVCRTYYVTRDQALTDVEAFLSDLRAIDAIHVLDS